MDDEFVDPRANGELAATELRTTRAVRERCGQLLDRARLGHSAWFEVDEAALPALADRLAETAPHVERAHRGLPYAFWRHLDAGLPRWRATLDPLTAALPPGEQAHAWVDLAALGALAIDPGRDGPAGWAYTDVTEARHAWQPRRAPGGRRLAGPAGLACALFHAFTAGLFSGRPDRPCQADALGLRAVVDDRLAQAFQVHPGNPLPGLPALAIQLRRLGEILSEQAEVFGDEGRPAGLFDLLVTPYGLGVPPTADVDAHDLLSQLLATLCPVLAGTPSPGGIALGDCWRHPAVRGPGPSDGWVPFHERLQWMARSLLAPFEWAGVHTRGLAGLTPLAHAAHGSLLLDAGVLRLRNPALATTAWRPGDEIVVEWRALTVALVERAWTQARAATGTGAATDFEGVSTQAGLELARQLRAGRPALAVGGTGTEPEA